MPTQKGTVIAKKGKYYAQVGQQLHELVPNELGGEDRLKEMVGMEVQVVFSKPELLAVIPKKRPAAGWRPQCYLCYIPAPDDFKFWNINPAIREANLKVFLEQGLISQEVYDQQMKVR